MPKGFFVSGIIILIVIIIVLVPISPDSYNLPLEYTKLAAECSHDSDVGEKSIWICKPVGQSQGKGIFLISVRD